VNKALAHDAGVFDSSGKIRKKAQDGFVRCVDRSPVQVAIHGAGARVQPLPASRKRSASGHGPGQATLKDILEGRFTVAPKSPGLEHDRGMER
jgi:hypothetical protein